MSAARPAVPWRLLLTLVWALVKLTLVLALLDRNAANFVYAGY